MTSGISTGACSTWNPFGGGGATVTSGGGGATSGSGPPEVVDWGRSGPNEMLTLNALRVLKAAG